MNAETHFGQTESRLVFGDAVAAGERQFQAATQAKTMHQGQRRKGQFGEVIEHSLTAFDQCHGGGAVAERGEFLDVGAGDEAVGLIGQNY